MMRLNKRFPNLLFAALFLLFPAFIAPSTGARAQDTAALAVTYDQLVENYRTALKDAQEMRVSKIDTELTLITKSNANLQWKTIENQDCVKVALLADSFYDAWVGKMLSIPAGRITWVGVPSDFQAWYVANHPAPSRLLLRLKQLMGMPPDVTKTRMVEVWVNAAYLKRPSIEPAIDKEIDLSTLFTTKDRIWYRPNGDNAFNAWFYRQCAESYVIPPDNQSLYPWTRLGYTYDWGNPIYPHIGISEFIIWSDPNGVQVLVESSSKPEAYFHK